MSIRSKIRDIDYRACGLYTPGHQVHFIQAKLAWEGDPKDYRHGVVLSVADDGWITVEVDREIIRFWNHDPARARECFEASDGRAGLTARGLLHAPTAQGNRYCICISTEGPTPCAPPPPPAKSVEELAEQVRTHGGFLARPPRARGHVKVRTLDCLT